MTDTHPEALRLAALLDADEWPGSMTLVSYARECVAELRRLHDENTTLQAGYDAARLEIESLQARIKAMAEARSDEMMVANLDGWYAARNHALAAQPAGEYPLPGRTTDDLMESQRESAIAAYRAAHGHDPDFGFAPDRAWIEGAAYVDADRAMRAAQPAGAQQPGAWVPLPGTLPDPGKPVLLDIGKKYPIRAMWAAKHTVQAADDDTDWGEYVEEDDMYYAPEGWYEWNECEDNHWRVTETPRAWAPLPPTTSAGSGKGE